MYQSSQVRQSRLSLTRSVTSLYPASPSESISFCIHHTSSVLPCHLACHIRDSGAQCSRLVHQNVASETSHPDGIWCTRLLLPSRVRYHTVRAAFVAAVDHVDLQRLELSLRSVSSSNDCWAACSQRNYNAGNIPRACTVSGNARIRSKCRAWRPQLRSGAPRR